MVRSVIKRFAQIGYAASGKQNPGKYKGLVTEYPFRVLYPLAPALIKKSGSYYARSCGYDHIGCIIQAF